MLYYYNLHHITSHPTSLTAFVSAAGLLDFFILENVDSMSESNLTICLEALAEIDGVEFEVEVLNLLSSDYSLPQSRTMELKVGWVGPVSR